MTEPGLLEQFIEASAPLKWPDYLKGLRESFDRIATLIDVTDAALLLYDPHGQQGQVEWCYMKGSHIAEGGSSSFSLSETSSEAQTVLAVARRIQQYSLYYWVLRHRQTACVLDTANDDRWTAIPDDTVKAGSALCVPVLVADQIGALLFFTHPAADHFTPAYQHMTALYADRLHDTLLTYRLNNQFQQQQQQYKGLIEIIPDILLLLDQQGRVILANPPALHLLDVNTLSQATGKNLTRMILPDDTLASAVYMMQQGIIGEAYTVRSERLRQHVTVQLSSWLGGYILYVRAVGRENDLQHFKTELLRLLAQDFRSALSLIIGYTHMIRLDTPERISPVHQHIEVIESATGQMNTLLDHLLQLENIRSAPLQLQSQVDAIKLVKIVNVNMRLVAEHKQLDFKAEIAAVGTASIRADPVLMRQAMEHLVANAIQYTRQGSVEIQAYTENGRFYFTVRDTGPGIPEEHIGHIFEPFYRWESKGAGLGLSLVQDVIERHHGAVWVESEPGQGSTFGFWLPLSGGRR